MTTSLSSVEPARPSSSGNTRRRLLAGACALLLAFGLLGAGLLGTGPLVSPAAATPGSPQVPWVPDASVYAVAVGPDGTQYLGGEFEQMMLATGGGARVDASAGTVDRNVAPVIGTVYAVADDGSGGVYIGGDFIQVGTQLRTNLAHIKADGTVDADWAPEVDDTVYAIAVASGTVYVGGEFTASGGQTRRGLAAFAAADGDLQDWDPDLWNSAYLIAGTAKALVVGSNGTVYVGGSFDSVNVTYNFDNNIDDVWRNSAAAFDAYGVATDWDPSVIRSNPWSFAQVRALAICGSTVYLGGQFDGVNYVYDSQANPTESWATRNNLAAVDTTDGDVDAAWNPDVNGPVNAIAVGDCGGGNEAVNVGGDFDAVWGDTMERINIARFEDANGSNTGWVSTSWVPEVGGEVFGIAITGGDVAVVGDFTEVTDYANPYDRNYAAMFEQNGYYFVEEWNPNLSLLSSNADPIAYAITTLTSGSLYLGGAFDAANGVERSHLAALDSTAGASGALLTSWHPVLDDYVSALAIAGSRLYVGGDFTDVDGEPHNHLARVALSTGVVDSGWSPDLDDDVDTLAVDGTTTYAGGRFTTADSEPRNSLASFASDGTATTWNPDLDGGVWALATGGTTLFAGGGFTTVGGSTSRNSLAGFDQADGALTDWSPNLDDDVDTLAVDGTTLFAGGGFTSVAGSLPRSGLVSFDLANDGLCTAWAPTLAGGAASALAVDGSQVYAGGDFTAANGAARAGLALFDATDGSLNGWDPSLVARSDRPAEVWALAHATVASTSTLYVAGWFAGSQDVPTARFYLRMTPSPQAGGSPSTGTACSGGGSGSGGGGGGGGGGGSSSASATTSTSTPTAAPTVIAPVDTTGTPTATTTVAGPAKAQVGFAAGSSALSRAAKARLDALVKRAKQDAKTGSRTVTIVGAAAGNRALAKKRAETVAAYLRARGLTGAYTVTGKVGGTGRQFATVTVGSRT